MNKFSYLFILFFLSTLLPIISEGQADSGRSSAADLVDSESFVGTAYLDLDAVIDDYHYPYEVRSDDTISFHYSLSPSVLLDQAGETTLQISFVINQAEYFPSLDFNYIVYINDRALLEEISWRRAIARGLEQIRIEKSDGSKIYLFLEKDGILEDLSDSSDLNEQLSMLAEKTQKEGADYFSKARRDLEKLLRADPQNGLESRYFWLFNKSLTRTYYDVRHLYEIVAGMGDGDSQISFCGNDKDFRAATLNEIVDQFGGNTWYFSDEKELEEVIIKDYRIYKQPAISDLKMMIYNRMFEQIQPVREISLKSMGPEEHRTYLIPVEVTPPLDDLQWDALYPAARILVEYYDVKSGSQIFDSMDLYLSFTDSYREQVISEDYYVYRNREILDTYKSFNYVALLLRQDNYRDALLLLRLRIERLERVNAIYKDEMIAEDIQLLRQYRQLIFDNRDNPFRALKSFSELTTKVR